MSHYFGRHMVLLDCVGLANGSSSVSITLASLYVMCWCMSKVRRPDLYFITMDCCAGTDQLVLAWADR